MIKLNPFLLLTMSIFLVFCQKENQSTFSPSIELNMNNKIRGVRQIAGHAALVIKSTTFDQLLLWWATRRFTTCCTPSFVHRCPERFTLSWITTR